MSCYLHLISGIVWLKRSTYSTFHWENSKYFANLRAMAASKPVFYYDNRSPPVRSIRLLIAALQIDVTEKEIDLFTGEHMKEEYLKVFIE